MRSTLVCLFLLAVAAPAAAYIGPGLGAGAVAVVVGVLGSIVLALFAILWFPIKRLLKRRRAHAGESEGG